MVNDVREAINILNANSVSLKNFNELGIYLAKQNDTNALNILKLLIYASECGKLNKDFDVTAYKSYIVDIDSHLYYRSESVFINLIFNTNPMSLDLIDFLLRNYKIDLKAKPYDDENTVFSLWLRSLFKGLNNDNFDKKIKPVYYMLENNLLTKNELAALGKVLEFTNSKGLFDVLDKQDKVSDLTNKVDEQLSRLDVSISQGIVNEISELEVLSIVDNDSYMNGYRSNIMQNNLNDLVIGTSECDYIERTIPVLSKNKIIK